MNAVSEASGIAGAYDVIVVGAGPAGLAAATLTAQAGLSTLLLDENASPGGQVYRATTHATTPIRAALGGDYARGARLAADFSASGATYVPGAVVWHLDGSPRVGFSLRGQARVLRARRVVIASGAMERPFPIPGWTLPGVMSVGAAQTALKASGMIPQGRVALAGLGPLVWLTAAQILRLGGKIEAILDTTPIENRRAAAPHALGFALSPYALKGLALMAEVRAKTKVISGVDALEAYGEGALEGLRYRARVGSGEMALDALFLHQGVAPNVNLAMAAGIAHRWEEKQACFVPTLDDFGKSSVETIFIAGDGAGIAGALAAEARGRLAALGVARALGARKGLLEENSLRAALTRALRGRAFLDAMFKPATSFRVPAREDVVVCRCEEATAGQVRAAVAIGASGPNQLKAYLRCGMGPCQGRMCGLTVVETIAAERGTSPDEVGYLRLRPPVKPITLDEMASIPVEEAEYSAVVRE